MDEAVLVIDQEHVERACQGGAHHGGRGRPVAALIAANIAAFNALKEKLRPVASGTNGESANPVSPRE
ncbi:MAG: hypothetical protein U1E60_21960 [Reyranellaceae bacterium]